MAMLTCLLQPFIADVSSFLDTGLLYVPNQSQDQMHTQRHDLSEARKFRAYWHQRFQTKIGVLIVRACLIR